VKITTEEKLPFLSPSILASLAPIFPDSARVPRSRALTAHQEAVVAYEGCTLIDRLLHVSKFEIVFLWTGL